MRRKWIIISSVVIFGALALFEIYSFFAFPEISYSPKGLPPLSIGASSYDFFKDNARVGSYVFRVDRFGEFKGQAAYFTSSITSVFYNNMTFELETYYVFSDKLKPLEYRINATLGEDRESIVCLFDGNYVNASLVTRNGTMSRRIELPENTVLIDNNMVGHWDLFFKSFDLIPEKRFYFNAFVPQVLNNVRLEVFVDKNPKTVSINGVDYECQVVRGTELSVLFYIYKGSILWFEDTSSNVKLTMLT